MSVCVCVCVCVRGVAAGLIYSKCLMLITILGSQMFLEMFSGVSRPLLLGASVYNMLKKSFLCIQIKFRATQLNLI